MSVARALAIIEGLALTAALAFIVLTAIALVAVVAVAGILLETARELRKSGEEALHGAGSTRENAQNGPFGEW